MKKIIKLCAAGIIGTMTLTSCTDLTENIYSRLTKDNYYTDKSSVEAAVLRPYEHGDWCGWESDVWKLQELTGDHFVWTQKGRHGYDDGQWIRLHEHKWNYIQGQINGGWVGPFQGINQINTVMRDLNTLDFAAIGITEEEKASYFAELRVLRAWYYTFLLDFFRQVPIVTEKNGAEELVEQSSAKELFTFIETEIKEVLPSLPKEKILSRWTQGPAAALLVRLYLNAEVWIGENHYNDCKTWAQDIIDGKYGTYSIVQTDYKDPFRSGINDYQSPENLFEFWHARGRLEMESLWDDVMHYTAAQTIGSDRGGNNGVHLQPSRGFDGQVYQFKSGLGNPFEKYADCDYRKQPFRTTDASGGYEGFFLQGAQMQYDRQKLYGYTDVNVLGTEEYSGMPLVFVDQVGRFSENKELKKKDGESDDAYKARYTAYMKEVAERGYFVCTDADVIAKESQVTTGEENSGIRFNKRPYLPDHDGLFRSQSSPEIRLSEIYYSLAECYYREGNKSKAAELLDYVRVRNYPAEEWNKYSYKANPSLLTDQEFIDEWGREFIGERRRRMDLVRWNKFHEEWWNKGVDATDKEYKYFPIPQNQLNASPILKQTTPGWE